MPVPEGTPHDLAAYLEELEGRIAALESPGSPGKLFTCLEADLPAASSFYYCALLVSDLDVIAHSNGVDWIRSDTGAAI